MENNNQEASFPPEQPNNQSADNGDGNTNDYVPLLINGNLIVLSNTFSLSDDSGLDYDSSESFEEEEVKIDDEEEEENPTFNNTNLDRLELFDSYIPTRSISLQNYPILSERQISEHTYLRGFDAPPEEDHCFRDIPNITPKVVSQRCRAMILPLRVTILKTDHV